MTKNPYDLQGTKAIFIEAVKENIRYLQAHSGDYKRILEREKFSVDMISHMRDLADIPIIPTLYLKKHPSIFTEKKQLAAVAMSSGTSGYQSKIAIDKQSLLYGLIMAERMFRFHGLISCNPVNYALFGHKPKLGGMEGAARTLYGATMSAPALHRAYAIKRGENGFEPDTDSFLQTILAYEKLGLPVRFMGFPAYMAFLLNHLESRNIRLHFHPDSKVLLGGGWKMHEDSRISKEEMRGKVMEYLGIPETEQYEFFSAVEHPVSYCSCKNHHFHVPVYSRVIVRDVNTLKPMPYGTPGLLNFITPVLSSAPCVSVMTDDIGMLCKGEDCGCGIKSPYFVVLKRAGEKGIKTCAAQELEHMVGGIR